MGILLDYVYVLTVATIRAYKWLELQILQLFSGVVQKLWIYYSENWLGVVVHLPGQSLREISEKEEKRILASCGYNSLIHLKVNNPSIFTRSANTGPLAMGEAYVNGDWETLNGEEDITEMSCRIVLVTTPLRARRWELD
ncbi:unnamed protein product [Orchesella dallaii]|uniref:Uncharacterized protein n=1 Tax=Orchesella dallaii TaxID=48710 RepID=A0ABP1RI41_9HEXA